MSRLRESPRPLQVVAIAWLAWFALGSLLYGGGAPIRVYVFAFIVLLTVAVILLRGSRIAWVLVVLVNSVALVSALFRGEWWWALFHLALLAVLLTVEVRWFIWHQRF